MKESAINTIISNNFKRVGFAHKISDFREGVGVQNPFDGFGVAFGKSFYWETKRIVGYQAFNFKRIEKHQIDNLTRIKSENSDNLCWIVLAIWEPRKLFDLMFFDILVILEMIKTKKSVLKKELLELREAGMFLPVKKKEFDVERVMEITIDKDYSKTS